MSLDPDAVVDTRFDEGLRQDLGIRDSESKRVKSVQEMSFRVRSVSQGLAKCRDVNHVGDLNL